MSFTITAAAARMVRDILATKGGGLSLRIRIRPTITGLDWSMRLEPTTDQIMLVSGVPIVADGETLNQLDGLIIDWVQTPAGPGFGIYDQQLSQRDLKLGAD